MYLISVRVWHVVARRALARRAVLTALKCFFLLFSPPPPYRGMGVHTGASVFSDSL